MLIDLLKINKNLIIGALWVSFFAAALYIAYGALADDSGYEKPQPVRFSHKTHSEKFGIKCLYCHRGAEKSAFSPVPETYTCMVCHSALGNENDLLKPVYYSDEKQSPIKWDRLYALPEYSHFNHSRHIRAQIDCASCHGEVEKDDTLKVFAAMTMKWCLDCHRNPVKFIVPARDISGIFTDKAFEGGKISLAAMRSPVIPQYGEFITENLKPYLGIIPMPRLPGKGPEHCSACHY